MRKSQGAFPHPLNLEGPEVISRKTVKELLFSHRAWPKKRLGQHFLIKKTVLKKIIEAAEIAPEDTILEVGPGIGVLTKELARIAKKVIAVEKDLQMVEILKDLLKCWKVRNVEIIQADILQLTTYNLQLTINYKVVANIPYYLTSPLIRKFLEAENSPKEMILLVQKEVAQRICSKPPQMNFLAISVQFYAQPKIISYVSKNSFWPKPKVDSAILRIAPLINTDRRLINADLFFKIVRAGFSHPRKQILNNLSNGLKLKKEEVKTWLEKQNLKTIQRAQELGLEDWICLTKSFILK